MIPNDRYTSICSPVAIDRLREYIWKHINFYDNIVMRPRWISSHITYGSKERLVLDRTVSCIISSHHHHHHVIFSNTFRTSSTHDSRSNIISNPNVCECVFVCFS